MGMEEQGRMDEKRQIIMKLRNDRLNCDSFNKKTLNNACEKLAAELYSTKTHFFYEIVQNAEDNQYPSSVKPSLNFFISSDNILIQNNELGFTEKDIQSISDIGKSEKEKSEKRHDIGEKGIGFKSVFGITDTPMIFSNGYQFQFNANEDLGYITPQWIEEVPKDVIPGITNLRFPLNSEGKKIVTALKEIEPEILLFLKRLRKIDFKNDISGESFLIEKKKVKDKIILNLTRDGKEEIKFFHHLKKGFQRPSNLVEKYRDKITKTEIEFAFPLEKGDLLHNYNGRVFSFLPITSYDGKISFPFIIQADFLLTSNRSEIRENNDWNIWLRENLVDLFMYTIENFKQHTKLKFEILNILPKIEENNTSFFGCLGPIIDNKLQGTQCILTVDKNWVTPSQVIVADREIINLIPNKVLNEEFSLSFIHFNFFEKVRNKTEMQKRLNIRSFALMDLLQILRENLWFRNNPPLWFIQLFDYLGQKLKNNELKIPDIESLQIFRLENGDVVDTKNEYLYLRAQPGVKILFDSDFRYLQQEIYENYNKEDKTSNLTTFFNAMQIEQVTPLLIIKREILWQLKSEKADLMEFNTSFSICNYIRQFLSICDEKLITELKKSIKFRTKSKIETHYYRSPANLYLTKTLGILDDLESILEASDDRDAIFVSDLYVKDLNDEEKESWLVFFDKMGVQKNYHPIEEKTSNSSLSPQIRTKLKEILHLSTVESLIDYQLPVAFNLAQNPIGVLCFLAEHWDNFKDLRYQKVTFFEYRYRNNVLVARPTEFISSWFEELTIRQWLPTTSNQILSPREVYLNSSELRLFSLGDMPLLISGESCNFDFSKYPEFLDDLGIKFRVTVPIVLQFIQDLKEEKNQDSQRYFDAYYYLNRHFEESPKNIKDFFQKEAFIFLPSSKKQFYRLDELVWDKKYNKKMFRMFWGVLDPIYLQLKEFFLKHLQITEKLKLEDLCSGLLKIVKEGRDLVDYQIDFFYEVYKQIDVEIGAAQSTLLNQQWFKDFSRQSIFYTNQGFWWNDNDIFYNDDDEISDLFKDEPHIAFINIKDADYPKLRNFLDHFAIKPIAEAIKKSISTNATQTPLEDLTDLILDAIPYVVRFIYCRNLGLYSDLKEKGIFERFLSLNCFETMNFEFTVSLLQVGEKALTIQRKSTIQNVFIENNFYLEKNRANDFDLVGARIAQHYFGDMPGLDDFISNILVKLNDGIEDSKLRDFFRLKKISFISNDEKEYLGNLFDESDLVILFEDETVADEDQTEPDEFIFTIPTTENSSQINEIDDTNKESFPNESSGHLLRRNRKRKNRRGRIQDRAPEMSDIEIIGPGDILPKIENVNGVIETFQPNPFKRKNYFDVKGENISVSDDEDLMEDPHKALSHTNVNLIQESSKITNDRLIGSKNPHEQKGNFNKEIVNEQNEEFKRTVGIWGEKIVFLTLKQKIKSENSDSRIITDTEGYLLLETPEQKQIILKWLNANGIDAKKSYDLVLFQNKVKSFIEVKSTKSRTKNSFQISGSEWAFAKQTGEHYSIFRVFDAISTSPKIVIIPNPYQKWIDGEIIANPIKIDY